MRRFKQMLPLSEAEGILKEGTNGILSVVDSDGWPYGVPLSYAYDGKYHIYFHCALQGRKLECIKTNPRCSFCVVGMDMVMPEKFTTYFRSVIVNGLMRIVTDKEEIMHGLLLLCDKYSPGIDPQSEISGSIQRVAVLCMDIDSITGKEAIELVVNRQVKKYALMFQIRRGEQKDIDGIMACYESARSYMRASGNFAQWINGYPSRNLVLNDISSGISYVGEDADGQIVAAFVFIVGEDPTYAVIEDGAWPNDLPYGTIHRLGSTGKYKGVLEACVKFCLNIIQNIRLDTHRDNFAMKRAVARLGFERCGIIYCIDGTERIAYQKSVGL